jgi:hypothetical protein
MTHLRHRLNDEQTDNGHNFLRQVVRLNPWKESGLAQWHRVVGGLRRLLAGGALHSGNTLWKS